MTKIKLCSCVSVQQDAIHGTGNRVHNSCKNAAQKPNAALRCTVCGDKKERK